MKSALTKLRGKAASIRLAEDRLIELVLEERSAGQIDKVAMTKAMMEAEGNADAADALYVKHRINRIKDTDFANIAAAQEILDAANRHNGSSNSTPDKDDVGKGKKDGGIFWDFMAFKKCSPFYSHLCSVHPPVRGVNK